MNVRHDPSVEELRIESERTRAELSSTVSNLRGTVSDAAAELKVRVSPSHIKDEIRGYVRDSRDDFVHSIERRVQENPLQAMAIGAALAYPLWGVVRAMPAPLMLVGAGIWFAGKSGRRQLDTAQAAVADAYETAASQASEWSESAQAAASQGLRQVTEPLAAAGDGAASLGEKARASMHAARDSITDLGQAAIDSLSSTATQAADAVSGTVSGIARKARGVGNQSRNGFMDLVDNNPLLVAGIGLAIGAFVAASLPSSETENRMFGGTSDDLKAKASEFAGQGLDRAKATAEEIIGDVTAATSREGLDADGIHQAVKGLTDSVKAVADRGVKTALGETAPKPQDLSQPSNG